jgi:hypothetical protein
MHKSDDGCLVRLAIYKSDAVESVALSWAVIACLNNQHELRGAPRYRAAKNGPWSNHLQFTVNIEHHFVRAHAWHDNAAVCNTDARQLAQLHPLGHVRQLSGEDGDGGVVSWQ